MEIKIKFKDKASFELCESAFASLFNIEKDIDGNDVLTLYENAELHIQNHIKKVVDDYVKQSRQKPKNNLFKNNHRERILLERKNKDEVALKRLRKVEKKKQNKPKSK